MRLCERSLRTYHTGRRTLDCMEDETSDKCFSFVICALLSAGSASFCSIRHILCQNYLHSSLNAYACTLCMFHTRRVRAGCRTACAFHCSSAEAVCIRLYQYSEEETFTSAMDGSSSNSLKTYTPGAAVASCTNFAAAAPFADLAIKRNGSSLPIDESMFAECPIRETVVDGMRLSGDGGREQDQVRRKRVSRSRRACFLPQVPAHVHHPLSHLTLCDCCTNPESGVK